MGICAVDGSLVIVIAKFSLRLCHGRLALQNYKLQQKGCD